MDTFGAGTKCPSKSDVCLTESNKRGKERQGPTLGVCFIEVYQDFFLYMSNVNDRLQDVK